MIERTLVLLKPDSIKRGLIGEIIQRFEKRGLKIVGLKMIKPNKELISAHYKEIKEKKPEVYENLEPYMLNKPVVAMVIEGINAIKVVRKLVGPTEPFSAPPGTIRGDYAHTTLEFASKQKRAAENLIHASSSKEEAEKEINIWFSADEILDYDLAHEEHTLLKPRR